MKILAPSFNPKSASLSTSGKTSFTASWAEKRSAHCTNLGVLASETSFVSYCFPITSIHTNKLPSAMSTNPILSPPKKAFPLLNSPNAPSNTTASANAAFLSSSVPPINSLFKGGKNYACKNKQTNKISRHNEIYQ